MSVPPTHATVPEHRKCLRPTKAGTPCQSRRITIGAGDLRSCHSHLTPEERTALGRDTPQFVRLSEEEEAARFSLALDKPPACWFWPVPPNVNRTEPEKALREWQDGRCAICGDRDALVMDHNHETGMCRGLLDRSCNIREGAELYRDRPMTVFAYYRQRPPLVMLGLSLRYVDGRGPDYGYGPPPVDPWRDNALRGA